jgi:hypothetical protein
MLSWADQRRHSKSKFHHSKDHVMKRIFLSLVFAATLIVGSLATPSTADAQRGWRGRYYGGYYGGYYRPYYGGGYYRPYYGGYYSPYGSYYRGYSYGYPGYYRGYGYGYPGGYYYGSPGYYSSPGVRIGAGVGGVGAGVRLF